MNIKNPAQEGNCVMKIAAFIDGANLYRTQRELGFDVDYKRLLKYLGRIGDLVTARYYTAIIANGDDNFRSLQPLVDWLAYNGYIVVSKDAKTYVGPDGRPKTKGNMDIELAVDMLRIANHVDQVMLFSGDGDFCSLVEAVQREGVRVTVVSTTKTKAPMAADELRRQADVFIDLEDLRSEIESLREVPAAKPRVVPAMSAARD